MRKFLGIIAVLSVSSMAFADVYVIADKDGKIYTMSEKNDTVVPEGMSLTTIRGKTIESLGLTQAPDMYDVKGESFKLNSKRVADKADAENRAALAEEDAKVKEESAKAKLAALGLTADEIAAIVGK